MRFHRLKPHQPRRSWIMPNLYCVYRRRGSPGLVDHWYYTTNPDHLQWADDNREWHWLYADHVPWRRWVQEAVANQKVIRR